MLSEADLRGEFAQDWGKVVDHFEKTGKKQIGEIAEARDKGSRREPKHHDIFVHPQLPFSREPVKQREQRDAYIQCISNKISSASNPLFITYTEGERDYPELSLSADRSIAATPYPRSVTGSIHASSLGRLLDLLEGINKDDRYRVHGAAFGCCPLEFAKQLYGIAYAGMFWPDIPLQKRRGSNMAYLVDRFIDMALDYHSLFEKSSIRAGVLHDTLNRIGGFLNPSKLKPSSIQIVDADSQIFPYDGANLMRRIGETSFHKPYC